MERVTEDANRVNNLQKQSRRNLNRRGIEVAEMDKVQTQKESLATVIAKLDVILKWFVVLLTI